MAERRFVAPLAGRRRHTKRFARWRGAVPSRGGFSSTTASLTMMNIASWSVQLRAVDIVQPDQAQTLAAGGIDYWQDGDLRRAIFHEAECVEQEGIGTDGDRVDGHDVGRA